ncbi:MAG: restriction endonuclease subunit S [Desulfobacula sp.]|nr:restriction endonuclease subunit S [Desulfobacula sp.]
MKQELLLKGLGEICHFVGGPFGGSLKKSCFEKDGNAVYEQQHAIYNQFNEIRYYVNDIKFEKMKRFELLAGDLIMSCSGTMGKVAIVPDNIKRGIINQALLKLTPSNHLNVEYLKYWMTSNDFQKSLAKHTVGAAIKNVASVKVLKQIEIPLPPLPEQKRIVAILDKAFAAIAKAKTNAEQNLKNAKELFESYLQGVFENKGDDWEEKCLEDLVDEKCTLSYGIVQPGKEYSGGLPVIRPTDLTGRFISLNDLKRIDPKLADGYKRTKLIGNELLLCVRGNTGVVSIAIKELEGANVTRGIVPIRFNSKVINQEYGYYLLISNYIQKQVKSKTYGAALMQINIRDLRKIQTLYPQLKEQKSIVKRLNALSSETKKLEAIYQQKIEDLEELKKSVLQKAFNGELT